MLCLGHSKPSGNVLCCRTSVFSVCYGEGLSSPAAPRSQDACSIITVQERAPRVQECLHHSAFLAFSVQGRTAHHSLREMAGNELGPSGGDADRSLSHLHLHLLPNALGLDTGNGSTPHGQTLIFSFIPPLSPLLGLASTSQSLTDSISGDTTHAISCWDGGRVAA